MIFRFFFSFCSSDSGEEKGSQPKKKKGGRRILYSDSDVKLTDCDSDSDNFSDAKKNSSDSVISLDSVSTKKEKEKKRRGRKRRDSKSSDTDSSFEEKRQINMDYIHLARSLYFSLLFAHSRLSTKCLNSPCILVGPNRSENELRKWHPTATAATQCKPPRERPAKVAVKTFGRF